MYVTYAVYAFFAVLLIWGGRFSGKGKFHDDFMSLEVTKALRGISALGVIVHHIAQEGEFQKAGELSFFSGVGFLFVAVFFFCSGYGLIKSMDTKQDYMKGFLSRRLPVIVVPYYVSVVVYTVWKCLSGVKFEPAQWVTNTLGLTMVNEYAWYLIVLAVLYVAFYLTFGKIKKRGVCLAIVFAVVVLLGAVFAVNGHFAWWAGKPNWWLRGMFGRKWWMADKVLWFSGEWWVNSAVAFWLGLFFACHEKAVVAWFRKMFWVKVLCVIILAAFSWFLSGWAQSSIGYWTEWNGNGPGIGRKFITFLLQMPQVIMCMILLFLVMNKYHAVNPVSSFFGKISLETYMMNLLAITVCRGVRAFASPDSLKYRVIYALSVIALSIAAGLIYKGINSLILNVFRKRQS